MSLALGLMRYMESATPGDIPFFWQGSRHEQKTAWNG